LGLASSTEPREPTTGTNHGNQPREIVCPLFTQQDGARRRRLVDALEGVPLPCKHLSLGLQQIFWAEGDVCRATLLFKRTEALVERLHQ
jgi:hypothetical protein